jgi:hypothetical protein
MLKIQKAVGSRQKRREERIKNKKIENSEERIEN